MRSLPLVAVLAFVAGCANPDNLDPTKKIAPAKSTAAAQVTFDPERSYAIRPTTLDVRESFATYCRLGTASQYTVFAGSITGSQGNCNQDQIVAEGPIARVRLGNGQLAGVFELDNATEGRFARVVDSYNLGGSIPVTGAMPLHQFRANAVHVLASDSASEQAFQQAILQTFPSIQNRLAGRITETIAPRCKANRSKNAPFKIASLTCDVLRGAQIAAERERQAKLSAERRVFSAELRETLSQGKIPTDAELAAAAAAAKEASAVSSAPTAPAIAGSPALFEGSKYAAFTPELIEAYCQQDWQTRVRADGRTEYNPCFRREAFD